MDALALLSEFRRVYHPFTPSLLLDVETGTRLVVQVADRERRLCWVGVLDDADMQRSPREIVAEFSSLYPGILLHRAAEAVTRDDTGTPAATYEQVQRDVEALVAGQIGGRSWREETSEGPARLPCGTPGAPVRYVPAKTPAAAPVAHLFDEKPGHCPLCGDCLRPGGCERNGAELCCRGGSTSRPPNREETTTMHEPMPDVGAAAAKGGT